MPDSRASLFAYGSLQLPEIFEAVTQRSQEGVPAVLRGFRRTKLRGFGFPALLPAQGAETPGILYPLLDEDAWRRLDAFEDDFYQRTAVTVHLTDTSLRPAHTYVLAESFLHLSLDASWALNDLDQATIRNLLERL